MGKIRISAVSYLNTKPFLFGLENSSVRKDVELSLDFPSVCAQKLIKGEADLGLIPVAAISLIHDAQVVSDYCIGAIGKVRTVNLYSEVPVNSVKKVLLDYQSQTSVSLVKLLAKKLWIINPEWESAEEGYTESIGGNTAGLVIGDRTLSLNGRFQYVYDLAEEWYKLTQLPFVFAAWVANKELTSEFINQFNEALRFGVDNRHLAVELWQNSAPEVDLHYYFDKCISYHFDEDKKKAMKLFFDLLVESEKVSVK